MSESPQANEELTRHGRGIRDECYVPKPEAEKRPEEGLGRRSASKRKVRRVRRRGSEITHRMMNENTVDIATLKPKISSLRSLQPPWSTPSMKRKLLGKVLANPTLSTPFLLPPS